MSATRWAGAKPEAWRAHSRVRQTGRHAGRQGKAGRERETLTYTHTQRERHTDIQTYRHADIQTHRHTDTPFSPHLWLQFLSILFPLFNLSSQIQGHQHPARGRPVLWKVAAAALCAQHRAALHHHHGPRLLGCRSYRCRHHRPGHG